MTTRNVTSIALRFYLLGYGGSVLPRTARTILLRSQWHRAWLAGHIGSYAEGRRKCGVLDRQGHRYRKGPTCMPVSLAKFVHHMLHPFSEA